MRDGTAHTCDIPASVCDMYYVKHSNKDVNLWCVLWSYRCVLVHIGLMFLVLVKGDSDDYTCACLIIKIAHIVLSMFVKKCDSKT
jgi:hypothetical protein